MKKTELSTILEQIGTRVRVDRWGRSVWRVPVTAVAGDSDSPRITLANTLVTEPWCVYGCAEGDGHTHDQIISVDVESTEHGLQHHWTHYSDGRSDRGLLQIVTADMVCDVGAER